MAGLIHEIAADQYDSEVIAGGKVVLDFYSTECPPCEALAAKYEGLAGHLRGGRALLEDFPTGKQKARGSPGGGKLTDASVL